ncbi:MAG: tyrosine-type recombinase/integrase [Clostridia bacterium]|nr:tyrosine-type recombinase/integrase [Clostridia bacterium]
MTAIAIQTRELAANSELDSRFADFIAYLDVKPATLRTYINGVKAFLGFLRQTGMTPSRQAIMAFRDSLTGNLKATTCQTYMSGVRRFFAWLSDNGLMTVNPASGVKSPKVKKDFRKDALTQSQAQDLLASVDRNSLTGKRDYAMLALMLTCGLRDCEVARARISDLRTIGGQSALMVWGKGRDSADEAVKLAGPVEAAIRAYLHERGETDKDLPLFASASNRNAAGAPLTTRSISRLIKTRLQAIGLDSERLTAHSLRHSCATLARLAGASREEVQATLRHASSETTAIYDHAISWAGRKVETRVADALFK